MAILITLIIILIVAVLAYLVYSPKLLDIGKKAEKAERTPLDGQERGDEGEGGQDEQGGVDQDGEEGLVDLFEIFGEGDNPDAPQSEQVKSELFEKEQPTYDKLTDLMTCRSFMLICGEMLETARKNGTTYAVAYFDIDRFRFINSIKGYSLGDFVLTRLSQEIKAIFPPESQFARISADHFVVMFPIGDEPAFDGYSDQIKKACEKIRLDVAIKGSIRTCMGVAVTESASNPISYNISVLMHKANIARHCLKASKSESYSVYNETMISSHLYGESILDDYGENQYGDDFTIYFQAITDLNRKHIAGCDALVRWNCQEDSGEPLTSDNGHIPTNITKIIYHTCRAASRWRKTEKEIVPLYIYITETEFFRPDLDEFVAKCVYEFQIEPGMVYIVINASVLRIDWSLSNKQVKRLRDTGLKVGVCGIDVNTRDLEFLAGIPINFIKLNYSFSLGLSKSPEKAGAVRTMLAMAQAQNLRAVFEDVNTIEQMQEHMKLGSGLVEGRCNGQPMLADDFVKMLDEHSPAARTLDSTVILEEVNFNQGDYNL